jgi:regulator of cell morphogenesis and NO signaling
MNDQLMQKTIGELVAEDYRKAEIFKQHGIDFCCGGKKTVTEVCTQKGVDPVIIEQALHALDELTGGSGGPDVRGWGLPLLCDYIVDVHHIYVRECMPRILEYAQKVAKVHGHAWPENIEILYQFKALSHELTEHMMKEEQILFPWIKRLVQAQLDGLPLPEMPFGALQNPIDMMETEHESAGDALRTIAELSHNYTPPEGACNTYRVLYALLEEFENDLHRHVHLENNILFPKALKLERSLSKN